MEINKSKTIEINWLGNCPTCDREEHMVSTSEGNKDYLYEDDTVKCWCGQTGVIETDGEGHAWCNWDEKAVSEWDKFNIYYRQKFPEYWDLLPKANHQACQHHEELFNSWVEAKSKAVPEGFVLVPTEKVKYFSHDGENYEIHDTLAEAKHEAECAIEHFSERLADQLCDPRSDGNFHDVGYGIVLGKSGYSVDHIVTQEDMENGEYGYEVGTEIMSLFLIEAQEQSHESE